MLAEQEHITISKEFRDHIIPLNKEELEQLEKNIIAEGCREPLVVWQKDKETLILVDGHNRFSICKAHDLPYKIKKMAFKGVDDVKLWMTDNQMGRRNLTPDQVSYYRGLKYLTLKKARGGYKNVVAKKDELNSALKAVADKFSVSGSTIKRDAKFAQGLEIIGRTNSSLKLKILTGQAKVKKSDVQILSESKNTEKLSIRNEAELHNVAKGIRNDLLDQAEAAIKSIENEKVEKARAILKEREPVFLPKGDRVRKIKGMIISAINKAINKNDVRSIKELKRLIDELEQILF